MNKEKLLELGNEVVRLRQTLDTVKDDIRGDPYKTILYMAINDILELVNDIRIATYEEPDKQSSYYFMTQLL